MQIDVHIHHDPELRIILEQILRHVKHLDEPGSISSEDQKLLDDLNARAEAKTKRLQALDAQNSTTPAV